MLNVDIADRGTAIQVQRAEGVLFVEEGNAIISGTGGEVATLTGFAVGTSTGHPPSARFASCSVMRSTSRPWLRINSVAAVSEYEIDGQGHYTVRVWEWK